MPQVRIAVVDHLPTGALGSSLMRDGVLEQWDVTVQYFCKSGVLQLPIADDDDSESALVQVHSPMWQKRVEYVISRVGAPGFAPDFETDEPNETLLDFDFKIGSPIPWSVDGQNFMIRRWGHYLYALKKPPDDPKTVRMPFCVYHPTSKGTIKPGHWTKRVMDF